MRQRHDGARDTDEQEEANAEEGPAAALGKAAGRAPFLDRQHGKERGGDEQSYQIRWSAC